MISLAVLICHVSFQLNYTREGVIAAGIIIAMKTGLLGSGWKDNEDFVSVKSFSSIDNICQGSMFA